MKENSVKLRGKKLNKIKMNAKFVLLSLVFQISVLALIVTKKSVLAHSHKLLLSRQSLSLCIKFVKLPHTNYFLFLLFSFSWLPVDEGQFMLITDRDEASFNRKGQKKTLGLDVERYFFDGYYVCPNPLCDRK